MEIPRNTKQRQLILAILTSADKPMSINEIYQNVILTLPTIAKSTIYRNIAALLKQNLIDKYYFSDNEVFYRIKSHSYEHKHYVLCNECKSVFKLPSCPIHDLENAMEEEGFVIQKHQFQITGICKNCISNT